jgi:hypothetical protein
MYVAKVIRNWAACAVRQFSQLGDRSSTPSNVNYYSPTLGSTQLRIQSAGAFYWNKTAGACYNSRRTQAYKILDVLFLTPPHDLEHRGNLTCYLQTKPQ